MSTPRGHVLPPRCCGRCPLRVDIDPAKVQSHGKQVDHRCRLQDHFQHEDLLMIIYSKRFTILFIAGRHMAMPDAHMQAKMILDDGLPH